MIANSAVVTNAVIKRVHCISQPISVTTLISTKRIKIRSLLYTGPAHIMTYYTPVMPLMVLKTKKKLNLQTP